MFDYKLMRASKYGNCCQDCAAVLELAPGLFERNHRYVSQVNLVQANSSLARNKHNFWTNIINTVQVEVDELQRASLQTLKRFDTDSFFAGQKRLNDLADSSLRASYLKVFEESMAIFDTAMHNFHLLRMQEGTTKLKQTPQIYV